ncbi:MAG: Ig-like domain repeat protein [Nocardioides marinisabuli]|uniref:Ig-like domain repeat protein n=1 Tax=Nocardioides marinisabuli TaxID=419476 RepID=UPI003219F0E1
MNRARRTPHTRLRTRLGAGLGAALTTALVASGAGLAAPATAAPAAPPSSASASEHRAFGLLEILSPAAILGALDGTAQPGTLLGLQRPSWGFPDLTGLLTVTESVQWLRDGKPIDGATGDSYLPTLADAGSNLQAVVTGKVLGLLPVDAVTGVVRVLVPGGGGGGGGSTTDPLEATQLPRLTGIPGVGSLLQVLDPVWSLPGVSTTYQWFADDAAIPGATGQTFVPGLEQAGTTIYVQVTGVLAGLPLVSVLTNHLPIPAAPAEELGATSQPTVSGTPKVGKVLTVSDPAWNTDGVAHGYQWLRDGAPVEGATLAAYQLTPADLGHAVSATVTGTKEGWTSATVDSNALTATLGDAIVATLQPRVTGTAALGQALTATPGTWGAGETPVVAYQWLRDGSPVSGATASSYAVTVADLGRDLALRVTATRTGYVPGSFTTAALPVARATTSTTAKAARKKIRQGRAAVLTITVDAAPASPDGKVAITEGGRTLKTFSIAKGSKKVRIKKLATGKHTLRVGYLGSETTADSRARKVVVRVLKKRKR